MEAKNSRKRKKEKPTTNTMLVDVKTRKSVRDLEATLRYTTNDGRLLDETVPSGIFTNFKHIAYPNIAVELANERKQHEGPTDFITTKVCNLMVERDSCKTRIEELESQLKTLKDERTHEQDRILREIHGLKKTVSILSCDIEKASKEKKKIEDELNRKEMFIMTLQAQLKSLQLDSEKVKKEKEQMKKEIFELKQKADKEIQQREEKIVELEQTLEMRQRTASCRTGDENLYSDNGFKPFQSNMFTYPKYNRAAPPIETYNAPTPRRYSASYGILPPPSRAGRFGSYDRPVMPRFPMRNFRY